MYETKNKTLEEIDQLFMKPTSQLVKENTKSAAKVANDLMHFRFKRVFIDKNRTESDY
jgi:hypothetical protein